MTRSPATPGSASTLVRRRARAASCAAGLLMLSGGQAWAQAQPTRPVGVPSRWELDIGGGMVKGFGLGHSKTDRFNPIPWGSFTYKDRIYANGLDGLGYNLIKQHRFRMGLQVRPHYGGGGVRSEIERPDTGVDVAAYAFRRTWKDFVVGGRITHDVSNVSGGTELYASVSHQDVTPVGLLQTVAYGRARNEKSARAYYGVPREEAGPAFPAYRPDGGLSNLGAAMLLVVPLGQHYGAGGFVNYERAVGDAGDSPLVRHKGQVRAGLMFVRRFRAEPTARPSPEP